MLDQKKIIALTGAKGVGKTTIAKAIESKEWNERVILSFADPLRSMLARILPMSYMTDTVKKEQPIEWLGNKSPRQLLQTLGTAWGRGMVSETIWIDAMHRMIKDQPSEVVIIDDCRFENEADMVRDAGGIVIRLERAGIEYTGEHSTEMGINNVDATVCADDVEAAADQIEQLAFN